VTARRLSADDVCAYVWGHSSENFRASLCALAAINQSNALLEWFELGVVERQLLRMEIADVIEANASRQRAEYAPERAA